MDTVHTWNDTFCLSITSTVNTQACAKPLIYGIKILRGAFCICKPDIAVHSCGDGWPFAATVALWLGWLHVDEACPEGWLGCRWTLSAWVCWNYHHPTRGVVSAVCNTKVWRTLIARFMGPIWGPSGADRTQVGPMLASWILLSGNIWYLYMYKLIIPVNWSRISNCVHHANRISSLRKDNSHI